MAHSIRLLFIFFFFIVNLNIRSIDCALPIHDQNLNNLFNLFEKVPSIIETGHDTVERFQCLKGRKYFGGSCYLLSNTTSMPSIANQTCSRHLNNSQLMKIRHPPELFYAAYVLKVYNLPELMIEIDSQLLKGKNISDLISAKDRFKWQQANDKFRQQRDAYYNRSQKNYNYTFDYNEFERFDDLYHACDKFVWSVPRNDPHVFLLTTYLEYNKTVCSLSYTESDETYPHLCQYVLDYCLANDKCGIFGRCTNTPTSFKCSCFFLFDGPFCRSLSGPGKQMIIVLIIIIVLQLYIRKESLKSLWSRIKGMLTCCKTQQEKQNDQSAVHSHGDSEECSCFGWCLFGVSILILALLLAIPIVYRSKLLRFDYIDQLDVSMLTNDFKQMIVQCKSNSNRQWIIIGCSLLTILIAILILFFERQNECGDFFHDLQEFLIPFKPFDITNRYETASIFSILVFEVLTSNYIFIDLSKFWGIGVLSKFAQKFLNIVFIVIKYYPILISLRQTKVSIHLLALLYSMANIGLIIFDKTTCIDLFPRSEKISDFEEAKLYVIFHRWIIGYGLIRNMPYSILLAYIGAQVIVRFIYRQNKKSEKTYNNINQKSHCSCIKSIFNYIYPWNDKFRFVTISLCIYGTSFIFLYYLICTLTFDAIIGRSDCIPILIDIVESMLNIEIQHESLCRKIILSGIITMIIISYLLFTGMKNCKKNAKKPCPNTSENDPSTMAPTGNSITSELIQSLKLSVPYIVGGVYILFPLILFFLIIVGRISTQFESFEPLISFILPPLLLYGLQTSIMQLIHILFSNRQSENSRTVRNNATDILSVIVITLFSISNFRISIVACVFLLFKVILYRIISGTQIDCSHLGQPSEVFETINDKTSNSQDEHGIQPIDTSSTSPAQPSDSDKMSSMDASYCSPELTSSALQAQMSFSPDCKPPQSGHIQQEKCSIELVHETTKNRRNSTLKPKHPHRDRGNIIGDDLNSPHQRPLLPKNSTSSQK